MSRRRRLAHGLGQPPAGQAPRRAKEEDGLIGLERLSASQQRMEDDAASLRARLSSRRGAREAQQEREAQRLARAVLAPRHYCTVLLSSALLQWLRSTELVQEERQQLQERAQTPRARQTLVETARTEQAVAQYDASVVRLQAWWRGHLQRRQFQSALHAELALLQAECASSGVETAAAISIQAAWRGYIGRGEGARRMQGVLATLNAQLQRYNEMIVASQQRQAVIIQRVWRGWLARRRTEQLRHELNESITRLRQEIARRQRHLDAVVHVQSHARGWIVRRRLAVLCAAATLVQACWRGWLGRVESLALAVASMERSMQRHTAAAVCAQRVWRGHTVRRRLVGERRAATLLQSLARLRLVQLALRRRLREVSALCIQSHARGMFSRRRFLLTVREEVAALEVIVARNTAAEAVVLALVQARAERARFLAARRVATKMQAVFRGGKARTRMFIRVQKDLEDHAASLVQGAWRQRQQFLDEQAKLRIQLEIEERESAAKRLQRAWRRRQAFVLFAEQLEQDVSAEIIQNAWRRKRELKRQIIAGMVVLKLQAIWRGRQTRKEIARLKAAQTPQVMISPAGRQRPSQPSPREERRGGSAAQHSPRPATRSRMAGSPKAATPAAGADDSDDDEDEGAQFGGGWHNRAVCAARDREWSTLQSLILPSPLPGGHGRMPDALLNGIPPGRSFNVLHHLAFCAAHDNATFDDAAAQVLEVLVGAGCRFDTSVKTGSSTLVRRPFLPTANFRI